MTTQEIINKAEQELLKTPIALCSVKPEFLDACADVLVENKELKEYVKLLIVYFLASVAKEKEAKEQALTKEQVLTE